MSHKIIAKLISPVARKVRFQKLFEHLNDFSLYGMNIGGGADFNNSGEKKAVEYIKNKFISLSDLVVFDVGANVGNYALLLKEVLGEKADIYSFEPSVKTFDKLQKNIAGKTKIYLQNFGLGDNDIKTTLYTDSEGSGLASVYQRRLDHFHIDMDKQEEIEIKTLDTFCFEKKISHIHFLKLDVEGNELKVLEGAKKMLETSQIDFIQFEFGGCNIDSRTFFQDFYYLLKDNYKIYRIVKDGLYLIDGYKEKYESFVTTNYLAERKK